MLVKQSGTNLHALCQMPFILRNDVIYTQPARLCAIQTIAAKSTRYHTMISDVFMFMLFL